MNFFEFAADAVKPFLDGDKPPLNVGEVMNLWFYLTATDQSMSGERMSYNTVEDAELKEKLGEAIETVHAPIHKQLVEFLTAEGVPLPDLGQRVPIGEFGSTPLGARMPDQEVANLLSFNIVLGINYACRGMTESVRSDVAAMFAKYQMKKMAYSISLRELMKTKGWLKVPPYYKPQQA